MEYPPSPRAIEKRNEKQRESYLLRCSRYPVNEVLLLIPATLLSRLLVAVLCHAVLRSPGLFKTTALTGFLLILGKSSFSLHLIVTRLHLLLLAERPKRLSTRITNMVVQPKRLPTKHVEYPKLLVLALEEIYGKGNFGVEIISNAYSITSKTYEDIDMVSKPYLQIRVSSNRLQIYPQ